MKNAIHRVIISENLISYLTFIISHIIEVKNTKFLFFNNLFKFIYFA